MAMLLSLVMLVIGFYLLLKGADLLVKGSSSLAKILSVSEVVIGLTIVAFGTSMPELIVNILSTMSGHNEIVFGNIIGSNIFNILVILGISGSITSIIVEKHILRRDIPYSLLAVLLLFVLVNDSLFFNSNKNVLSRIDGIIFLAFFAIFLVYLAYAPKRKAVFENVESYPLSRTILYIIVGLVGLFVGGKVVVDSSIFISRYFGASEKLIALTIIAGGTSLPELATSAVAAYKKRFGIAVGNIIGSNVFNIFFILGIGAVIGPAVYDTVLNFDVYFLIFATLYLFFVACANKKRQLNRFWPFLMLIFYGLYLAYLFFRK